ncbi:TIGR04206 family protein [Halorubrum vacuolatum]|uniref:TIGR04206 family protein n=1 Tax=Halorubrum vacuolatum TaxID=63740 RepID=A0A238WKY7_HALVU|nr:TIGR04206 family protein [Halorubrum vacuolatum]SNR47230.1 TIGR04206 family protein [Halorubrum vacuolatum]
MSDVDRRADLNADSRTDPGGAVRAEGTEGGGEDDSKTPSVSSLPAFVAVLALLAVPMTVVPSGTGDLTLVSLWGFINTGSVDPTVGFSIYPVWDYFGDQPRPFATLPASIQAWPLALAFHLLAVASAGTGRLFGREDRRVTGGLIVLGALATLWVTVGVASRFGAGNVMGIFSVLPVSTVASLAVVIAVYRNDLRRIFR